VPGKNPNKHLTNTKTAIGEAENAFLTLKNIFKEKPEWQMRIDQA